MQKNNIETDTDHLFIYKIVKVCSTQLEKIN